MILKRLRIYRGYLFKRMEMGDIEHSDDSCDYCGFGGVGCDCSKVVNSTGHSLWISCLRCDDNLGLRKYCFIPILSSKTNYKSYI